MSESEPTEAESTPAAPPDDFDPIAAWFAAVEQATRDGIPAGSVYVYRQAPSGSWESLGAHNWPGFDPGKLGALYGGGNFKLRLRGRNRWIQQVSIRVGAVERPDVLEPPAAAPAAAPAANARADSMLELQMRQQHELLLALLRDRNAAPAQPSLGLAELLQLAGQLTKAREPVTDFAATLRELRDLGRELADSGGGEREAEPPAWLASLLPMLPTLLQGQPAAAPRAAPPQRPSAPQRAPARAAQLAPAPKPSAAAEPAAPSAPAAPSDTAPSATGELIELARRALRMLEASGDAELCASWLVERLYEKNPELAEGLERELENGNDADIVAGLRMLGLSEGSDAEVSALIGAIRALPVEETTDDGAEPEPEPEPEPKPEPEPEPEPKPEPAPKPKQNRKRKP